MPTPANEAKDIFLKALEHPEDPHSYVDEACGEDVQLRERVVNLLRAHREAGEFLDATVDSGGASAEQATREMPSDSLAPATRIGPYELLEEIGQGGMGSVWVAKQKEPIKRKVALKLIKAGMDSQQVLLRFEAERQALALMDHPNIARVLDGGLTEQGRPFFAMEYVKGVTLTEYCDQAQLTVSERLELFVPICNAVQHAHQKGIIHRDLKPANILICLYDGRPVPKVIDFGLAKAIHQPLTEDSIYTGHGVMVGTPLYMSPEQAEQNNLDIDTRTDVYALGVILYELLTGTTPLEKQQLKEAAFTEVLRLIKEVEPPKPSTRLSSSERLPSVAAQRSIDPSRLPRKVSGDLDWVVMRALEKERTRRYETANALAEDIRRHLADEPVHAGPPSAKYRLLKFARRHRTGVVVAMLLAASMLLGIVGTTAAMLWALEKRDAAETAQQLEASARQEAVEAANAESLAKKAAQQHQKEAEKRLSQVRKANEILGSIFSNLDPSEIAKNDRPLQVVLMEQLDQAIAELDSDSIGSEFAVAEIQAQLGSSIRGLGEPRKAIGILKKALKTYIAKQGAEHPEALDVQSMLAAAYQDDSQFDKAIELFEQVYQAHAKQLGPEHAKTLSIGSNLGDTYRLAGQNQKAIALLETTLKNQRSAFGDKDHQTIKSINNLAVAYSANNETHRALPLLEEALRLQRATNPPNHPHTLSAMGNLGATYTLIGQMDKAVPILEETLKLRREHLGSTHPDSLLSMDELARVYMRMRRLREAAELLEQSWQIRKENKRTKQVESIAGMANLGTTYMELGQMKRAVPVLEEAVRLQNEVLPKGHPIALVTMTNLAQAYGSVGKPEEALSMLKDSYTAHEAKYGAENRQTVIALMRLATAYADANRPAEVIPQLETTQKKLASVDNDQLTFLMLQSLIRCYGESGRMEEAAGLSDEMLRLGRTMRFASPIQSAQLVAKAAFPLLKTGRSAKAEKLLREAVSIYEKNTPAKHWHTRVAQSLLGEALLDQKKYEAAESMLLKAHQGMESFGTTIPSKERPRLVESFERLIKLYEETGKKNEAEMWKSKLETVKEKFK